MLALSLGFIPGTRADNKVTLSTTEGSPGAEVTVSVALENTETVSSLQVVIPIDGDVTLVDGSAVVGSRCATHSATAGMKDDTIKVLVYSLAMAPISAGSGEVVSFKLKLGSTPQTVSLMPSSVLIATTAGEAVSSTVEPGAVTTRCAKAVLSTLEMNYGRVPIRGTYTANFRVTNEGNEQLTITQMDFSDVNVFSTSTTFPLSLQTGESRQVDVVYQPVERGTISRTVKVVSNSISKLNTITLKAEPFAVNEIHVQPVAGNSDEEVTVDISMNNMDPVSGLQLTFNLPESLKYVDGSFALSSRKDDHVAVATLQDGTLRALAYSPGDKPFKEQDGVVCSFKVKLDGRYSVTLTPANVVLSATIGDQVENVVSAFTGATVTISSPTINVSSTLDFGAVSITEAAEKTLTVRNYGSAPLQISKVLSDNDLLSVTNTMPVDIAAGQSAALNVVYAGTDLTTFNGTLSIYSNDPAKRMTQVAVSGSRFAPNYLNLQAQKTYPDTDMTIDLLYDTYDDLSGLQFDLEYPATGFEPSGGNVVLAEAASGMTVSVRDLGGGKERYFCYFLSGGSIPGGTGKLMSIVLKGIGDTRPLGTYTVKATNIILSKSSLEDTYAGNDLTVNVEVVPRLCERVQLSSESLTLEVGQSHQLTATALPENATSRTVSWTSSNESVATVDAEGHVEVVGVGQADITATATDGSDAKGVCRITGFMKGDANADGKISISDLSAIVKLMLGEETGAFSPDAADANEDGKITVSDISVIVKKMLGQEAGE